MSGHTKFLLVASLYPPAGTAGLERGCQRLARALAARGHRVSVLTMAVRGLPACRDEEGVRVLRVLRPVRVGAAFGLTLAAQTAVWLWRLRASWDLVFCQQLYLHSAVAAPVAKRLRRLSANLLVASDSYSDVTRLLALRGGRRLLALALTADAQFVLSRRSRDELLRAGVPASRIFAYRYFVDTNRFQPGEEPGREAADFLFMGRFDPQKNLPLLLAAFEQVRVDCPHARLRIIGEGPEEANLRERAGALVAAGAVTIERWTEDPRRAYQQARSVVTATDAEGLSNVLIEAMACGAPVITTDVSGAREALGDDGSWPEPLPAGTFLEGSGGLLTNRGDRDALASAMSRVVSDAALRRRLSGEARARAVSAFSEEVAVSAFLDAVRQLRGQAWKG